jgi:hypothetical protein
MHFEILFVRVYVAMFVWDNTREREREERGKWPERDATREKGEREKERERPDRERERERERKRERVCVRERVWGWTVSWDLTLLSFPDAQHTDTHCIRTATNGSYQETEEKAGKITPLLVLLPTLPTPPPLSSTWL